MPEIGVDFVDERNSMKYWYPRVSDLDVPTLQTEFFDISNATAPLEVNFSPEAVAETLQDIPVEEIMELVEKLPGEKAHLRGDFKAAELAGDDGRVVTKTPKQIHEQVLHLLDSSMMGGFPITAIVVREWIDMEVLASAYGRVIGPEVRFIADEGEVLGGFVDVYEEDFDRSIDENEKEEILNSISERFNSDYDTLHTWASRVAQAMDDTGWSIDFVQDTEGDWHIVDMALYGLYWSEDKSKWTNISYIPPGKSYNLEENPPPSLPEEPTEDMTRVKRK